MIDSVTGDLHVDSFVIGAHLTREQFLASSLASGSRVSMRNEPRCSFITPTLHLDGLPFTLSLYFYGQQLEAAELMYSGSELGSSWADWSLEKERKRKQIHDEWLTKVLGKWPCSFSWGEISSEYDPKGGYSSIFIRYSWQGKPWQPKQD